MSCTKDDSSRMRPSTALGLGRVSGTAISICLLDMSFWDQNWWNFGEIYHFFMFFLRFRTFSWFFACFSTVWTARPRICSFLKPQLHHFLWPQSPLLGVHLARSCQKGHRGPWLRAFWWHGQDGAFLALNGRSGSQWFITVMAINISCNWISTGI